ncbi:MAG TPA: aminoglycoside phosphotransferase family protein [Micromonosporaceae bacterium]
MIVDIDDPGPVPERILVDATLVGRLIATQFPQWAALPVAPVAAQGWDNQTFRLGDTMLVRLPTAAEYALAVAKEQRWLPVLAPHLPLPVPVPLGQGRPDDGFPHPWSVYRWIDGAPATAASIADPGAFALALADFLSALQRVDPAGGPEPGVHNWFRGGPLQTWNAQMLEAIEDLGDSALRDDILRVWSEALDAEWDGRAVWVHGDIAAGNLLVEDGALSAVIDFGTCGVGDPACDLAIAWTLLTGSSRAAFRDRLRVAPAMWARGRGWALWKATVAYADAISEHDDDETVRAESVLSEILGFTTAH